MPETYWAMTVAYAAPLMPSGRYATNQMSSAMFKRADTARKISGTVEFPRERRRQEKKL